MISREVALTAPIGQVLYHRSKRTDRGHAVTCQVVGRCRLYGFEFNLPVHEGYLNSSGTFVPVGGRFIITDHNGKDWLVADPTIEAIAV